MRCLRISPTASAVLVLLCVGSVRAESTTFPPEARARYDQGQELQKQGKLQEAIKAYDEAIQLGLQDYPRVHLKRAEAYRGLAQDDEAIKHYTRFLERFSLEESCRY
jgi:tetratricopeptide (TPR) repeat protein